MLKICHVIISLRNFGGAERMLVRLLLANPATAGRHTVMVLRQAGACGEKLRAAGIQVYELGMDSFLGVPRVLYRLKELIRACDPDIVQTWMYHADLLGGLAARLAGYKNVAWGIRRTALTFKDSKSTLVVMKLCALLSTRIPRRIICVAEAGRQAHVKAGYNPDAMVVIPNGFDFTNLTATPAQRLEFRRACGFAEDEIVIGCLGRFHPAKDQENFVKAAALLAPGNPKIKFMLIGLGCDAANAQLLGWLQDYRLRDRFVLLGERAD
ncbi:MAG: glycosyltransferase, partial [Methylomonas sp.]